MQGLRIPLSRHSLHLRAPPPPAWKGPAPLPAPPALPPAPPALRASEQSRGRRLGPACMASAPSIHLCSAKKKRRRQRGGLSGKLGEKRAREQLSNRPWRLGILGDHLAGGARGARSCRADASAKTPSDGLPTERLACVGALCLRLTKGPALSLRVQKPPLRCGVACLQGCDFGLREIRRQ